MNAYLQAEKFRKAGFAAKEANEVMPGDARTVLLTGNVWEHIKGGMTDNRHKARACGWLGVVVVEDYDGDDDVLRRAAGHLFVRPDCSWRKKSGRRAFSFFFFFILLSATIKHLPTHPVLLPTPIIPPP